MRKSTAILLILMLCAVKTAAANEVSGYVAAEGRIFVNDERFPGQDRHNASIAVQPEYYHEWENGSSFTFTPFGRLDSADSERTHLDVRELNYLWLADEWELRVGVGKVFWGVTEFVHLVDIVNQTDLVENIDEEDKLGQPMVHFSVPRDWGVVDMFVLPYFRERTFPGRDGRLRFAHTVDTDNAEYESSEEERHVDYALRYSHTIGDLDFGIYHFYGTGREPTFLPGFDDGGEPVLFPFYELINQTGIDLQLVAGEWLWKLEALYRTGHQEDFFASVGGFEYSLVNIASSGMDLGLIGEWAYDERDDTATTAFQNDLMLGVRWALNDAASSEVLAGFVQDLESSSRALRIEGSRRFGASWLLSIEAWAFFDAPKDDVLHTVRDDDFLRLEAAYYF
jgi:hypothetical protein